MPRPLGPGPGAYMLPPTVGYEHHDISRYRNPQYSMRPRTYGGGKPFGPGPQYNIEKMTNFGKSDAPAYTIAPKLKPLKPWDIPGPGTYSPGKMEDPKAPAYSISPKLPPLRKYNTPGPNQYVVPSTIGPRVPHKPAAAAYSMGGKFGMGGEEKSPGPAKYGGTLTDLYKLKSPHYSIAGNNGIRGSPNSPGPAAYFPNLPGHCPGGVSFGTRNDRAPYITAEDHMPCID